MVLVHCGVLVGGEGDATKSKASTTFPFAAEAKQNPNLCPVCGQSWDKVDAHRACLKRFSPATRPVTCPSCQLVLHITEERPRARSWQIDRDMCSHAHIGTRAPSQLAVCPRCGFAAGKSFFDKPASALTAAQREWIHKNLTPRTHAALISILGILNPDMQPSPDEAYKVFDRNAGRRLQTGFEKLAEEIVEHQVPDDLRCENALLFAHEFYLEENPLVVANLAWLTAWSMRREVCGPINHAVLVKGVQRIHAHLGRGYQLHVPPNERVNQLGEMYRDQTTYSLFDRQVMLLLMAGDYQRLGYRQWALDCLKACLEATESDELWRAAEESTSPAERNARANLTPQQQALVRPALARVVRYRISAANREATYLKDAARFLRRALEQQRDIPPVDVPTYVYLVGEFERRAGNLPRAYAWLEAASALRPPQEARGAEIWAQDQLAVTRTSLSYTGSQQVPANPKADADVPLLQGLRQRLAQAGVIPGPTTADAGDAAAGMPAP